MAKTKFQIALERLSKAHKDLQEDPEYKALPVEGKITVWEIIAKSVLEDRSISENELGTLANIRSN